MKGLGRVVDWMREDADRAGAAVVTFGLGAVALAGSATHVLHVGKYPTVQVDGWMVWTVAGSLEVLAAYAAWEVRRRKGWDRVIPSLVAVVAVAFIVLANLAAADEGSWAAQLPWAQAFAVTPPVGFVCVCLIAETRGWDRPRRKAAGRTLTRPQVVVKPQVVELVTPPVPPVVTSPHRVAAATSRPRPTTLTVTPPEPPKATPADRIATARTLTDEGSKRADAIRAVMARYGVSEATAERDVDTARKALQEAATS